MLLKRSLKKEVCWPISLRTMTASLLEAMHAFFDYVQAESAADPEMRVEDLLEQLNLMRRYHITLPVWRTFGNRNGCSSLPAILLRAWSLTMFF